MWWWVSSGCIHAHVLEKQNSCQVRYFSQNSRSFTYPVINFSASLRERITTSKLAWWFRIYVISRTYMMCLEYLAWWVNGLSHFCSSLEVDILWDHSRTAGRWRRWLEKVVLPLEYSELHKGACLCIICCIQQFVLMGHLSS